MQSGGDFDATNTAYLVFLLIGIFGYTCVPTVAGWIVQSCGGGRFMTSITRSSTSAVGSAGSVAGAGAIGFKTPFNTSITKGKKHNAPSNYKRPEQGVKVNRLIICHVPPNPVSNVKDRA